MLNFIQILEFRIAIKSMFEFASLFSTAMQNNFYPYLWFYIFFRFY